jgi:hypothetical protein
MKFLSLIGVSTFCILITPCIIALSVTQEGYERMVKNVTCHQVMVENWTNYPVMVETIQLIPKQRAMVYEQCLNEYDRLSRSLGHTQSEPIKLDAQIRGQSYQLLNIPEGILSKNYLLRITQNNEGIIQIEEYNPRTAHYKTLPPKAMPAAAGKKIPQAIQIGEPELLGPGEPVEFNND